MLDKQRDGITWAISDQNPNWAQISASDGDPTGPSECAEGKDQKIRRFNRPEMNEIRVGKVIIC